VDGPFVPPPAVLSAPAFGAFASLSNVGLVELALVFEAWPERTVPRLRPPRPTKAAPTILRV